MDKVEARRRIEASLKRTKEEWARNGHKTKAEALRWWVAYNEAMQAVDSNNQGDWTELFVEGIKPTPARMDKLVEYVADLCDDEEELEAYLADMEIFYAE